MFRLISILLFMLALFASASAQQPTPTQQAAMNLGQQIGLLMQNNAELMTQIQSLNSQIAEKDKRIKELEEKYEPKK